jgi:hypothetical protein
MRAPPESLKATTGTPFFRAWRMVRLIFLACILPSVPATTLKSWLKAATCMSPT